MEERYEVVKADVGAGGFGRVHQAVDTILERSVAIKTLDPIFKLEPSPDDIERFRREAKMLASLSHPNIPAIYDVSFDKVAKDFKIIFEWIEGDHLSRYLQDRGVLGLEQARRWFGNVCSALDHAHGNGIIHRDIKPGNIILATVSDVCFLVDFGISLQGEEMARLTGSTAIGTPGYMSPEQGRGEDLSPASDLFSLAITLYECLAGTRPSLGGYHPLHTLNEAIPPAVDVLIQTCLREDPATRLNSAGGFFTQLTRACEPHGAFSDTLTQGSLHEIQAGLNAMTPAAFAQLPLGQRLTVITRLKDLVRVNEDRLQKAVATLLGTLVRIAHPTRPDDYRFVVANALEYGYERHYSDVWVGNGELREVMNEVAPKLGSDAHRVVADEVLEYLGRHDLSAKAKWWFHDVRVLLQNLLSNADCADSNAERLAEQLEQINVLSH